MYIKKFEEISKDDVATVGGKGASLGELTKAGFPVPPGFVITTNAFKKFQDKKFSEEFKKEIFQAFDKLTTGRVAVRSSAVAEDSQNASWAGQLDTYLNVTRENLLDNISLCFSSIKSARAKSYAKDKNVKKSGLVVAVVIQEMIESEYSGVMFTINPVMGNTDEIVIDAGYGLGEFIVQGIITPDNYKVDKNSLKIKVKDLGSKDKMFVYRDGKNQSLETPTSLKDKFVLHDDLIKKLSEIGKSIEKHYGFPCDIEWAYANSKFYITQSRPITTLIQFTEVVKKTNIPAWDDKEIFRWGPMPGKFFYISDYVESASRLKKYLGTGFPGTMLLFHESQMVWVCVQEEMTGTGKKIFSEYVLDKNNMKKWHKEFEKVEKELEEFQNQIDPKKINLLSKIDLKNTMENFYLLTVNFWLPTIPAELGNYGSTEFLKDILKRYIENAQKINEVVQILTAPEKLSYNQKEEIDLAKTPDLTKHLEKYFWLQNNYSGSKILDLDFFAKRKNKLAKDLEQVVKNKLKNVKDEKRKIIDKYNIPEKIVDISNTIWQNIVWQDKRKKQSLISHFYRFIFLKRSSELLKTDISILENLSYKGILEALDKSKLYLEDNYEYLGTTIDQTLTPDEAEIAWNNYSKERVNESTTKRLVGVVASKGEKNPTIAKVKIVTDPRSENFPSGHVLVTAFTSPEFVILMRKSVAVITNTGGLTSHAAIVSRELGIPCIVGTRFATEFLKDGDRVEINTDTGYVTKI